MRLTLSPRPNGITIRRVIAEEQTMLELTIDDATSGKCKLIFHCQADAPFIKELPAELLDEHIADEASTWLRMRVPLFMPQITDIEKNHQQRAIEAA
jgi:hypothetical protein